jgi:hypothetical protein
MPRFRNKIERTVVLECVDCKSWTDYPSREFRQDHLKRYLKQGCVTQCCGCGGKTSDGANTHHRVVGWVREEQRRLTPGGVTRFLNKLAQGKRKK